MKIITKTILTIVAILFANACSTTPTVKSVAGIYDNKGTETFKLLLTEDGKCVQNQEGKPNVWKGHWEIVNGELRLTVKEPKKDYAKINVHKINSDGSITQIRWLGVGEKQEIPRDKQATYKKLN